MKSSNKKFQNFRHPLKPGAVFLFLYNRKLSRFILSLDIIISILSTKIQLNGGEGLKKITKISLSLLSTAILIFSLISGSKICFSYELYGSDGKIYLSELFTAGQSKEKISSAMRISGNKLLSAATKSEINFNSDNNVVNKNTRKYLIPGGNLIGIRLKTDGVLIVGTESFESVNGTVSPADNAGIMVGDTLKTVEDIKITNNEQLSRIISSSDGNDLDIEIIREGKNIAVTLTPEISAVTGQYKCGLWIRDAMGGIGTLTYCDIEEGCFGSLGHGIYDTDTGNIIPTEKGEICDATLSGVTKGTKGTAGELKGTICGEAYGNIISNNENGIYGNIEYFSEELEVYPVAFIDEVTEGYAEIISTVRNNTKEYFDIEIEKINKSAENKNYIIRVTDEELLEITGGIVQGMSGSPIIQNGRIIGAVTHVFVNEPTKGYGIFIDNMLNASSD